MSTGNGHNRLVWLMMCGLAAVSLSLIGAWAANITGDVKQTQGDVAQLQRQFAVIEQKLDAGLAGQNELKDIVIRMMAAQRK